jgi:hypothetical protein
VLVTDMCASPPPAAALGLNLKHWHRDDS